MLDYLIVAPHPDDAELGMGGTIAKLRAEGQRVGIVDLTTGEPTPHGDPLTRAKETAAASAILDVSWRANLGLPNRSLEHTLEARRAVAGVFRQQRPKMVFVPYWEDAHPDHVAATQIAEAARFWAKLSKSDLPGDPCPPPRLIYYYCIHLRLAIQPSFIVDVSATWDRKRAAIECYHSQFIAGRAQGPPTILDRLRDADAHCGYLIGTHYGEPFASREPLGLSSLQHLLV